jgi:hypothetical protein
VLVGFRGGLPNNRCPSYCAYARTSR